MTPPCVLELAGVVKSHTRERRALDGVQLAVHAGRVTALLGPNGAGKSTLVSLAAGLTRPDAGTVRVLGEDPAGRGAQALRRRIGLAPQEIGVYPQLSVTTNLRCFAELYGLRPRAARARAAELLEPFALSELGDRPAGRLSGGEQRRLHAAIALVNRPALVILDEPTAGADPSTREHILRAVRDLAGGGTAVVYTTHYLPEAERLDADIALLEHGRVIARGSVAELIARHVAPLAGDGRPATLESVYLALTGRGTVEPDAEPAALP
ncbi:MAG: ABC transporter ATP-binding protein [Solirubrobacteraceae bacterium]|nr:ABC transporter ATP-binding protein [Solirubrobacteraceae bacterium]